jgi:hypothetical protein
MEFSRRRQLMEMVEISAERKAELEKFALEHGPAADMLDEGIASYIAWQERYFSEAVEGVRRGYADVKAGRTRPAAEFFAEVRRKQRPLEPQATNK